MRTDQHTNLENRLAGYRLKRLEVLNWGTFDQHVWAIEPGGHNALLTGDIGSGKSTLVDAITTLLVPHRKIIYNKAAGAESRERNLHSYILGAYKNEKVDYSSKARDVYLRAGNQHYTVLLAVFDNEGYRQAATLAQVFWMQEGSVNKFFVLAEDEMSIAGDFSNFGSQIVKLKKNIRRREHTQVFDSFADYANRFRQIFGIRQAEALDLFYQTVSMKSVGNLTDFVREQMLGQTDIQSKIQELVSRYGDLSAAHRAVQRAKEQHELLKPLVAEADQLENTRQEIDALEAMLKEIPRFFARHRVLALQQRLRARYQEWQQNEEEQAALEKIIQQQRSDQVRLESARAGLSVNQRLESIRMELEQRGQERKLRQQQADRYKACIDKLAVSYSGKPIYIELPRSAEQFLQQRQWAEEALGAVREEMEEIRSQLEPLHVRIGQRREQTQELDKELHSLRQRPTLIPESHIRLRRRLLDALNLPEGELPYAGELLQVREEEREWEGAIERQLHNLGLSLLVPDRHYRSVSSYVDRQHLGGKLVYLRTLEHRSSSRSEPGQHSLVHKVRIKSDTEFYEWLEMELKERYDYTCCETIEEFRRAHQGLTRSGLSKSGRFQHTKDDRYEVSDRRRYILGWSNTQKIAALERERAEISADLAKVEDELRLIRRRENQLDQRRDNLNQLFQFAEFETIHFQPVVLRIQELREEEQRLLAGSEELKELQLRINELIAKISESERHQKRLSEKRGSLRSEFIRNAQQIYEALPILQLATPALELDEEGLPGDMHLLQDRYLQISLPEIRPSDILTRYLPSSLSNTSVEDLDRLEKQLNKKVDGNQGELKQYNDQVSKRERSISLKMSGFKNLYPEDTLDVDADPRSIPEFRELYKRLLQDDIPRHEERFRNLLQQGTIRGILAFKSKLEEYDREMLDKINQINTHLYEIDYNPGAYIRIAHEEVRNEEILTFKQDLRACLSDIYGDHDNHYSEEKFLQVKKLLDRFRGESEEDSRWTQRVTDVRQWYTFGAEERWRETDEPHEYFSDSSGKSGGQKEKLAYTILASAIAFQFGLEWGSSRDRSFRFVVIDEAFGRGSDESTRYGLQLFDRLNLQLLIVTPLQKINIIEDYINAVHYVSNPSGKNSLVRNISKAEYLQEKADHFARQKILNRD